MLPRKTPAVLVAAALVASLAAAPVAAAQPLPELPAGISVPDVDLSAPVSVPAGTTTSVDLGVPLQVNYRQGGWVVVSNGTSVSVTAPETGSTRAAVPVSYAGRTATITLVAEAAGSGAPAGVEESVSGGDGADDAAGTGDGETGSGAGAATGTTDRPERARARPVDTADAELLAFDAVIEGRDIVVKLGMLEAANLYSRFKDTSRDGLKVRYVDADGNIIKGVKRDINAAARTMTLTYPEGQTPDNPFLIQLVRDDEVAEVIVTLTAPGAEGTSGAASGQVGGSSDGNYAAAEERSAGGNSWTGMAAVTAAGAVLALVVVLLLLAFRRSRRGPR